MDLKHTLQMPGVCMEAIGFLSMIFQWRQIRDMDLKQMLQMSIRIGIGDDGKDGRFPGGESAVEDVLTGLANEG